MKWDRDKIAAALIDLKAHGQALNTGAIQKSHPALGGAIAKHFPTHDAALLAALLAAGIDPASVRKSFPWDKARVVAVLLERRDAGLGLNAGAIVKSHPALSGAIFKRFGSHDAALLAAGVDPASVRKQSPWDESRVIAALRARQAAGLGLNSGAIAKEDTRLSAAMERRFGSHDAALRAAGIDPDSVRRVGRAWDKEKIVAALIDRKSRNLALNATAVRETHPVLKKAIQSHFGSHDAALSAAGIDPESVRPVQPPRPPPRWDEARVVAALRVRRDAGLKLCASAVAREDPPLSGGIRRYFSSHDAALSAAGIDPALVRKRSTWDEARVIAALRTRRDAGLALNVGGIAMEDSSLAAAIRHCFDSHDAALRAAGLDPESIRQRARRRDKAGIIAALRERQAKGMAINANAVYDSHSGLYQSALAQFGSYYAALEAAGIDPEPIRRRQPDWDQDKIVSALRGLWDKGMPVNVAALMESKSSLYDAIRWHFESHDSALRAAGIDPAAVRKANPWDKTKVVAALQRRRDEGLEIHCRAVGLSDLPLTGAIARYYGSHDEALRAAGIDPESVRRKRPNFDNDAVFAALRAVAQNGRLSRAMVTAADRRLENIARGHFGSLEAAAIAAGLEYRRGAAHRAGHWTEERVLQMLRDMHQEGHDLRYRPVKTHSQPLFFAAKELFGSYVNAVREAGIDYWQMSQHQLAKERAAAAEMGQGGEGLG